MSKCEKWNNDESIFSPKEVVVILAVFSLIAFAIWFGVCSDMKKEGLVVSYETKYSLHQYDTVESVKIVEDNNDVITVFVGGCKSDVTRGDFNKYVRDGKVVATNYEYTFYLKPHGVDDSNVVYKTKHFKVCSCPWDDNSEEDWYTSAERSIVPFFGQSWESIEEDSLCEFDDLENVVLKDLRGKYFNV